MTDEELAFAESRLRWAMARPIHDYGDLFRDGVLAQEMCALGLSALAEVRRLREDLADTERELREVQEDFRTVCRTSSVRLREIEQLRAEIDQLRANLRQENAEK